MGLSIEALFSLDRSLILLDLWGSICFKLDGLCSFMLHSKSYRLSDLPIFRRIHLGKMSLFWKKERWEKMFFSLTF